MSDRFNAIIAFLWAGILFRDLLRALLALKGAMPFHDDFGSLTDWSWWRDYVDLADLSALPFEAFLVAWYWRMIAWKS